MNRGSFDPDSFHLLEGARQPSGPFQGASVCPGSDLQQPFHGLVLPDAPDLSIGPRSGLPAGGRDQPRCLRGRQLAH